MRVPAAPVARAEIADTPRLERLAPSKVTLWITRTDTQRLGVADEHPSGASSRRTDVLAAGGVDVDLRLAARLAEKGGDLRRLAQVLRPRAPFVVAEDHVRAWHVAGVEPKVFGPGHLEGQVVVLARVAADEQRHPTPRQVVQGAGRVRAVRVARTLPRPGQIAPVTGVENERLAMPRRGELRARLAQPEVDLVARPLDASGLLEHPLGVGEAPEARVEVDGEEAPGLPGVLDLDRLTAGLELAGVDEQGLGAAPQVALVGELRKVLGEVRLQLLEAPDAPACARPPGSGAPDCPAAHCAGWC